MKAIYFVIGAAVAAVYFLSLCAVDNLGERAASPPALRSRQVGAHKKTASIDAVIKANDAEESKQNVKLGKITHKGGGKSTTMLHAAVTREIAEKIAPKMKPRADFPGEVRKQTSSHQENLQASSQDIGEILKRAATADKTVLMTFINDAWAAKDSFLDLFLESFREGEHIEHLVQHLVIVAADPKAFERCKSIHPHCYLFKVDGMDFAAEQSYMKGDYLEMMWRRNRFQQSILEMGYSFLFTDVDILWFRDPFQHISPEAQLVMSADFYVQDPNSMGNYPNGGLLYVRSCAETIGFYKHWQQSRHSFPGKHEQFVFDKIIKAGLPAELKTRIQFLDTSYFGGFCQHGEDLSKVCTMHANCCIGLENKLFDLRNVLQDWQSYKARIVMGNTEHFSWRVPGRCIH